MYCIALLYFLPTPIIKCILNVLFSTLDSAFDTQPSYLSLTTVKQSIFDDKYFKKCRVDQAITTKVESTCSPWAGWENMAMVENIAPSPLFGERQ